MAKKPSRKQRKVIREKHERAQAHGLPARALERPSKPAPANWNAEYAKRASSEDEDDERSDSETGSAPTSSSLLDRLKGLLERLKGLPVAAKLAAVVVVVVLVLWLVASQRRH